MAVRSGALRIWPQGSSEAFGHLRGGKGCVMSKKPNKEERDELDESELEEQTESRYLIAKRCP